MQFIDLTSPLCSMTPPALRLGFVTVHCSRGSWWQTLVRVFTSPVPWVSSRWPAATQVARWSGTTTARARGGTPSTSPRRSTSSPASRAWWSSPSASRTRGGTTACTRASWSPATTSPWTPIAAAPQTKLQTIRKFTRTGAINMRSTNLQSSPGKRNRENVER